MPHEDSTERHLVVQCGLYEGAKKTTPGDTLTFITDHSKLKMPPSTPPAPTTEATPHS